MSPNHGDSFSERDLVLAEDLAARCAMAIDNARLLQTAEAAQAEAGYSEFLETGMRGALNEAQLSDVRRIQANQRHLLGLVDSVLSYAKLEAGRTQFGQEDVPLADALIEVDGIIAPVAEEKGVECAGRGPEGGGDITVHADAAKVRQIIINLIANAIKFCEEGGRVEVHPRVVGEKVEIRVLDDGPGIAPEHLEQIFEPFAQVNAGYTQTHGGTGLGLAISRELARGMGGDLSVESELGRGSTFTLTRSRGRG